MDDPAPRLIADCMLGRLAKWLRLLSYDTVFVHDASDHRLSRMARSEGRVLLTRDRALAARRGLDTILIRSEQLEKQVEQVRDELGPPPDPSLSRCSVCNVVLERLTPGEAADRVPPYIRETHSEFRHCPGCKRMYWPGSHVEAMDEQLEGFESP